MAIWFKKRYELIIYKKWQPLFIIQLHKTNWFIFLFWSGESKCFPGKFSQACHMLGGWGKEWQALKQEMRDSITRNYKSCQSPQLVNYLRGESHLCVIPVNLLLWQTSGFTFPIVFSCFIFFEKEQFLV